MSECRKRKNNEISGGTGNEFPYRPERTHRVVRESGYCTASLVFTPMDIETVRRISLARHLYQLGKTSLASPNDIYLFAAVNLLQDAVEAFLIAVGDHVKAEIDQNTKFDKYFVLINEKISPKELPFKSKLLRLNRIRVDSKHYGIQPARDECERVVVSVREFFDEVSNSVLGVNFATVSAIDLLDAGEVKDLLLEAKAARESGDHETCVVACRKVLYVEVEHHYDVSKFKEEKPLGIWGALSMPRTTRRTPSTSKRMSKTRLTTSFGIIAGSIRTYSRMESTRRRSGMSGVLRRRCIGPKTKNG
jgi:hypothetical protein